jgi:hypothetical protein
MMVCVTNFVFTLCLNESVRRLAFARFVARRCATHSRAGVIDVLSEEYMANKIEFGQ